MEPHSYIAHNRKEHIDFYVKPYGSMLLCGSKNNWLLHPDSHYKFLHGR